MAGRIRPYTRRLRGVGVDRRRRVRTVEPRLYYRINSQRPIPNSQATPNSQLSRLPTGFGSLINVTIRVRRGRTQFWSLGVGSGWALAVGSWELSWEAVMYDLRPQSGLRSQRIRPDFR